MSKGSIAVAASALLLSLACSSARSADLTQPTFAGDPPVDSRGGGKTVVATVVSIDFNEDLLESGEVRWWWTVKAEVLAPRPAAGTVVVVYVDGEQPRVRGRRLAIGDRLAFTPPQGWEGRELWSGELDGFEVQTGSQKVIAKVIGKELEAHQECSLDNR